MGWRCPVSPLKAVNPFMQQLAGPGAICAEGAQLRMADASKDRSSSPVVNRWLISGSVMTN